MVDVEKKAACKHAHYSRTGRAVVLGLLILTAVAVSFPLREGLKQQRLSDELRALGCSAEFSHERWEKDESASSSAAGMPVVATSIKKQSTIPVLDALRLSPVLRRINRVVVQIESPAMWDATLDILRRIETIEHLVVNEPGLSSEQLQSLLSSVRCETLFVEGAKLPRGSLPYLSQHPLKFLYLGRSQFSNAAIGDLPDSLETLNLRRTRISDEGLPGFVRLVRLKNLNLKRTPTTEKGIHQLRQQMPWCKIQWEPLKK